MNKYYTKVFQVNEGVDNRIDAWLRSFERSQLPNAYGAFAEIVGYVGTTDSVVITVKRWEVDKNRIVKTP